MASRIRVAAATPIHAVKVISSEYSIRKRTKGEMNRTVNERYTKKTQMAKIRRNKGDQIDLRKGHSGSTDRK